MAEKPIKLSKDDDQQLVMGYLQYLIMLIRNHEEDLRFKCMEHIEKKPEKTPTDSNEKVTILDEDIIEHLYILHYLNAEPCDQHVMSRPARNEQRIKELILNKRDILQRLGIKFTGAMPRLENWLAEI